MRRVFWAALAAVASLALAAPAGAAVMVATYSGPTNGFYDTSGTFGFANDGGGGTTSFGWSATFVFDPSVGYAKPFIDETSTGGISASFTLGGYTINLAGTGTANRNFSQPYSAFENTQTDGTTYLQIRAGFPAVTPVPSLFTEFPDYINYDGSGGSGNLLRGAGFGGTLIVTGIDIRALPVPEPTSWALLIFGFGGVGAVLRRRAPAFRGGAVA